MRDSAEVLRDALAPLRRYLKGWDESRLYGMTPAEDCSPRSSSPSPWAVQYGCTPRGLESHHVSGYPLGEPDTVRHDRGDWQDPLAAFLVVLGLGAGVAVARR